MYRIEENISPKIIRSFIILFILIAIVNSITFGVAEYRQMKKLIKKEFDNISYSLNAPLSDAVWRGDRKDVNQIIDSMMKNYHITAVKIFNYEDKSLSYEKYKNGRGNSFSDTSTVVYSYNGRSINVATMQIYSDSTAAIYRSKKVFILLLLKTVLETITIMFLVFWAFRRFFEDYLFAIKDILGEKKDSLIKINLNKKNPIYLLEKSLRDTINRYIKLEIESSKQHQEIIPEIKKVDKESDVETPKVGLTKDLIHLMNPPKSIFKDYFLDIFTIWQPKKDGDGDIYLFSEVSKGNELLFMIVDYEGLSPKDKSYIPVILKEVERDIFVKQVANGKIFSLGKILDYIDKKIRSRLAEGGVNINENVSFSGLIFLYDKANNTITYSSNSVLLFGIHNGLISVFDEFGQFGEGVNSKASNKEYKEHTIDITEDDALIYLVTKGFFKQVSSNKKGSLGKNGFANMLESMHSEPFLSQETDFVRELNSYRGDAEQTDNITLIGMKFQFIM